MLERLAHNAEDDKVVNERKSGGVDRSGFGNELSFREIDSNAI